MSSQAVLAIHRAFEKHLATLPDVLPTAYENAQFFPVVGQPYQRVHWLTAEPENPTLGDGFYRERGLMQISLMYPLGSGTGEANIMAAALQDHFRLGFSATESGIIAQVGKTPAIAKGFASDGWWVIPVSVSYFANVQP